jgi:glycosyltransferase involved in cell wall biosynthesis
MQPRNPLVEGWRFIPHSYAIVNAHQLLELRKSPLVRVRHRDKPFHLPNWSRVSGLLDPAQERAIADIPGPGEQKSDAVYRISFPYDFSASGCERTCVFGTAEFGRVPDDFITGARSLREAMRARGTIVVTPSRWSRDGFIEDGADPGRVFVVPHGVDAGTFCPLPDDEREALRAQLGFSRFTLLSVGSMTRNEGLSTLLKAFAAVAARHPDVRLALKGVDAIYPSRDFLPREARGLTDAERERVQERLVYFGDTLSAREMAALYQASDLYVSPYLAEGFNLPVLEAVSCGLPVICTAGGPTDDFTTPEFALRVASRRRKDEEMRGWILEPNVDHLVQQILSVLDDPSICERAWAAGPEFARSRFTWKHAADRLLAVLFPEG